MHKLHLIVAPLVSLCITAYTSRSANHLQKCGTEYKVPHPFSQVILQHFDQIGEGTGIKVTIIMIDS